MTRAKMAIKPTGSRVGSTTLDDDDLEEEEQALAPSDTPPETAPAHVPVKHAKGAVAFGVILYAACSSTLLLINKVAVHYVPDASFILFCQFLCSAVVVRTMKCVDSDLDIEELDMKKVKPFFAACLVFFLCLLANTQALKSVNVETVIVARSCSPIAVSILEHVTLGRDLPNLPGILSLAGIAGGAVLYVVTDDGFRVDGYVWLVIYFVFIVVEMVFVKFVVETVPMSTWTRVYYNNALSIPLVVVSSVFLSVVDPKTSAFGQFLTVTWGVEHGLIVALSCIVGVAISYAGFNLRKLVSATTFTVIGVMCKLITVLLNDLIWSQHSNLMGHVGLGLCIAAGWAFEKSKAQSK